MLAGCLNKKETARGSRPGASPLEDGLPEMNLYSKGRTYGSNLSLQT